MGKGKGLHPEIVNKKSKGLDLGAEPPRMKSGVKRLVSTPVDGSYFYTTFLRSLPKKMRLAYRRRPSFCFTYMFKVNQRSRVVTESSGVMFDHFASQIPSTNRPRLLWNMNVTADRSVFKSSNLFSTLGWKNRHLWPAVYCVTL